MRIKSSELLDGKTIEFDDINVFIGGNNVGKTTILLEIFSKIIADGNRRYRWLSDLTYDTNNYKTDLQHLYDSLTRRIEQNKTTYYSHSTRNMRGQIDSSNDLAFTGEEHQQIMNKGEAIFLNEVKYRRPFFSFVSCEDRLGIPESSDKVAYYQPASDPINVLHRSGDLYTDIDKIIHDRFNSRLVILDHTGRDLRLGYSHKPPPKFDHSADNKQHEFEKIQRWSEDNFTPIIEAGHGMRSMIKILASILDPVNQVVIIDEPELHLYPSHKYWLGQEVTKLALKKKKQVFLVTHDPLILRGILDGSNRTNVFLVERDDADSTGQVRSCSLEKTKVSKNQDQYLQILFIVAVLSSKVQLTDIFIRTLLQITNQLMKAI